MRRFNVGRQFFFLAPLLVLLAVATAFGQGTTGTLGGVVKDPQGAVVPGAKVVVKNTDTGAETTTTTDADGFYRFEIGRASCRERV